ncbi:Lrp/AsnC family transcriptional regulator [Roseomonas sp. GCM10028921]
MPAIADELPAGPAPAGLPSMDEIDRKIIGLLQNDATLSVAQLADKVGLSPTPCWKRVQKLEAGGVITRRVALVDPEKIGVGLIVYVAIEAGDHTPEWLARFTAAIAAMPEVMEAHRMAGEVDYMLRVAVTGMSEFDALYKRLIAAVPMRNVTSRFAMEGLKYTTAYPLHRGRFRDRSGREGEG